MGKKRKFNRFIRWIKSDLPDDNKSVLLLGVTKIPSSPTPRARPHTLHLDHHLETAAKSQTLDSYPRSKPSRLFRSRSKDSLNDIFKSHRTTTTDNRNDLLKLNHQIKDTQNTIKNDLVKQQNGLSNSKDGGFKANGKETLNGSLKPDVNFKREINQNNNQLLPDAKKEVSEGGGRYTKKVSFCNNLKQRSANYFRNDTTASKRLGFCTELPYDFYHHLEYEKQLNELPNAVMDKSVDSIGSCSLDVDASSTDFSDSSLGSSDCTLRSLGVPTPTTQPSTVVPSFRIESTKLTDIIEPKKPSYLNLACTVNGYSTLTNYDSKQRENFRIPRSREVSPIRPQDYHANIQNGDQSKYLTPHYTKSLLTSPSNMAESKTQTILRSSGAYSYNSTTSKTVSYISKESRKFTSSMLYNSAENDTVDNITYSQKSNGFYQNKYESYVNGKTSTESNVQESYMNGQNSSKSFIQQRVERLYGPGALAQGFFISKRSKNRLSDSENGDQVPQNGSSLQTTQRITKLESNENEQNLKQSCSSPSLPVLRHLRPEFRAQLPILSPKRVLNDNTMQKSTTVPSSLTSVTNGVNEMKLLNSSKTVDSLTENKENIEKPLVIDEKLPVKQKMDELNSVKIITEEIPAAPQVILPITKTDIAVNGITNGEQVKEIVKDGHYFLKILKNETDRLIGLAEKIEVELEKEKTVLSDDVLGYLRSASGKARLLVTQKMQQFEGLCHKNINQIPGEQFPTTAEDLQGFWDMVMLQVVQVDDLFKELDTLRANNWIIPEIPNPGTVDPTKPKKVLVIKKTVNANAEAQRKEREAARKKMIEEKRKAMRNIQKQAEQGIEIFVPESS